METMARQEISEPRRISVRCRKCSLRLFDKMSVTSGFLELKCPRCNQINTINLSLRMFAALRYRRSNSIRH